MKEETKKLLDKASQSIHAVEILLGVSVMLQQAREFLETARQYLSQSGST